MPPNENIGRISTQLPVVMADNAAISAAFDMSDYSGGSVLVPADWVDANLGFKVCEKSDGTFVILKDEVGVAAQIAAPTVGTAYWYALPAALFGCKNVKLWSKHKTAGTLTDVNQTAGPLTFWLALKG